MATPQRAIRDANRITGLLGAANDGSLSPVEIQADPITGRLLVNATVIGGGSGIPTTALNENGVLIAEVGSVPVHGQVAMTGSAVALGSQQGVRNGLLISAISTNTSSVYVGGASVTSSNGSELLPGATTSIAIDDVSHVWVSGAAGQRVSYLGVSYGVPATVPVATGNPIGLLLSLTYA